jgi:hypothetical protein
MTAGVGNCRMLFSCFTFPELVMISYLLRADSKNMQVVSVGDPSADICIVVGEHPKSPHGIASNCIAVKEEWLLQSVESYTLPATNEAYRL